MVNPPYAPREVRKLFDFLRDHVAIQSGGFGASLRENRSGMAELIERAGWDYSILRGTVNDFERAIWKQYQDLNASTT